MITFRLVLRVLLRDLVERQALLDLLEGLCRLGVLFAQDMPHVYGGRCLEAALALHTVLRSSTARWQAGIVRTLSSSFALPLPFVSLSDAPDAFFAMRERE